VQPPTTQPAATGAQAGATRAASDGTVRTQGTVYRGGSDTISNLTPRPSDTTGLSTFRTLEQATPSGGKAQVIDIAKLRKLEAHLDDDPPGHVSLRPQNSNDLPAWAGSRDAATPHPYTQDIMDAIVDTVRRPK